MTPYVGTNASASFSLSQLAEMERVIANYLAFYPANPGSYLPPFAQRTPRYGPYDFALAEDGASLTCPAGKVSTTAYASQSGDGRTFRFFACQCWLDGDPPKQMKKADLTQRCPRWEPCRDKSQGPGSQRQVFISAYRPEVLDAQAYNQTETFKTEMKQRPLIERIV